MEVKTTTPEVEQRRGTLTQLLMADQPPTEEDPKETTTADNELLVLARRYGIEREDGIPLGGGRGIDTSAIRSSPSTTTRASCATAASAPATTSRATT